MFTMALSRCWPSWCEIWHTSSFGLGQSLTTCYAVAVWKATLTLALIFDTALGLSLEFRLDAVEQLVEALGWAGLGTAHDTRGVVVHGRDVYALVGRLRRRISCASASRRGLLTGLCEDAVCDGGS